jgi:preprotein translocase subunit SecA
MIDSSRIRFFIYFQNFKNHAIVAVCKNLAIPMAFSLKKLFNDPHKKALRLYSPVVTAVNALEPVISALSDEGLREKTTEFKKKIVEAGGDIEKENAILEEILPSAFAVVREASKRTLGQRHFDVQLIGGAILHNHSIAEMRTGEGKTLVATLPAYLNALTGRGVHIITVNDYLSRRDAVWMGQIFSFLGLTVGVINHESSFIYDRTHQAAKAVTGLADGTGEATTASQPNVPANPGKSDPLEKKVDAVGSFKVVHEFLRPVSRREAYEADITYGTNNEFGFDYLRDNLEYDAARTRQRDFNYAIVDEVDSILIDEARTPLIISAPTVESENLYAVFADIAKSLVQDEDYTVEEKHKTIAMLPSGIEKAEKKLGVDNIYTDKGIKYVHHLETAVRAKALFHLDKEYVVKNQETGGEIVIVDEFTGRLQPGRRWSEGLHQAIEAKEHVTVQKESRTFASITFQNYFRLYRKLAGMTGTAATSAEEFFKVYGIDTLVVPPNRLIARADHNDLIFRTEKGKFTAVARKIKELHEKGQPVLVGTVSIEKNEVLSKFLTKEGIPHQVLNAKNHEREGEIIAQAGILAGVTIATNMAGRGVDIKLGGNPAPEGDYEKVKGMSGLFVLGTERHEARRIDNQLRGRSGRQGDPGETQFFVSLEDSLMRVFAGDTVKNMMTRLGVAEDQPIENRLITKSLENAQKKIEGFNFDSRKNILEYDDVLNHQRKIVYERRRKILTGSVDDVAAKLEEIVAGAGVTDEVGNNPEKEALEKIIAEKVTQLGRDQFYGVVRQILLQTIDTFWVEHLEIMDYTRGSVNLRAYGQRDPLVEYKREGLRLFREMQAAVNGQVVKLIPHIAATVAAAESPKLRETRAEALAITRGSAGQGGMAGGALGGAAGMVTSGGSSENSDNSNAGGGAAGNRHQRRAAKRLGK